MGVFCCVSYNRTDLLVATAKTMRRWTGKAGGGPPGRNAYERGDHRVTKAASPHGSTQAGLQREASDIGLLVLGVRVRSRGNLDGGTKQPSEPQNLKICELPD